MYPRLSNISVNQYLDTDFSVSKLQRMLLLCRMWTQPNVVKDITLIVSTNILHLIFLTNL
jgi:hypothetical protein